MPLFKPSLTTSRAILLCLLFLSLVYSALADAQTADVDAFKSFVAARQSALSKLTSFRMKGTIKITEAVPNHSPRIYLFNFDVAGKGDKLRETEEVLNRSGRITLTRVYYLNRTKLVEVDEVPGQSEATLFTLGTARQYGLFNCPAFLEFSSLTNCDMDYGVPAVVPSTMASKEQWNQVLTKGDGITPSNTGDLRVKLKAYQGSSLVDLVRLSGSNGGYRVGAVSVVDNKGIIDRKIEVVDVSHDDILGEIGKSFRMNIFHGPNPAVPSHVWDFVINDIKINCPLDDDWMTFDPASVKRIEDRDHHVSIDVPK